MPRSVCLFQVIGYVIAMREENLQSDRVVAYERSLLDSSVFVILFMEKVRYCLFSPISIYFSSLDQK